MGNEQHSPEPIPHIAAPPSYQRYVNTLCFSRNTTIVSVSLHLLFALTVCIIALPSLLFSHCDLSVSCFLPSGCMVLVRS